MTDALDPSDRPEPAAGAATALATAPSAPTRVVALASGRSLEIAEGGAEERIQIRSTGGELLLSIRLGDDGPVLSLSGASLEIAATKTLALSCSTLAIRAEHDASVEVGGSLLERVRGSAVREVGRSSIVAAREVKIDASPGGVDIVANDDVAITGERVKLNSDDPPMPISWDEHRARHGVTVTRGQLAEGPHDDEATLPDASRADA